MNVSSSKFEKVDTQTEIIAEEKVPFAWGFFYYCLCVYTTNTSTTTTEIGFSLWRPSFQYVVRRWNCIRSPCFLFHVCLTFPPQLWHSLSIWAWHTTSRKLKLHWYVLCHKEKKQHLVQRLFSSCWPTRGHKGRSTRNSIQVMISSAGGAMGCSDHRFRAPPAYTVQSLTLHQHRANNQDRMANEI